MSIGISFNDRIAITEILFNGFSHRRVAPNELYRLLDAAYPRTLIEKFVIDLTVKRTTIFNYNQKDHFYKRKLP